MSAETQEGGRTTNIAEVAVSPGIVFEGMSLNGRRISLTHALDDDLLAVEPSNPRHDRLIVTDDETSCSYNWIDIELLGKGEPALGIARVYQTHLLAGDPAQAVQACNASIYLEQELSS